MKFNRNILFLGLTAAMVAPAAHAELPIDVIGNSEVSFEGLVQADANWYGNDMADLNAPQTNNDGDNSEFEMRRAELILKGKGMSGSFDWVLGYDARANKFLDVNGKYKISANPNHFVQVGQFKQPNSLEELSSTKNNDFIAKASATNTFSLTRRLGVAYRYGDVNWGITGSYFGRELTKNLAHGSGFGLRGNWAPINADGNLLHLGLSYVSYDTDADTLQVRARPLADLATVRLVDSGAMKNADHQTTIGAEALFAHKNFKIQGEYMRSTIDRYATTPANPLISRDFTADAWYVSGLWNITGETWGYKDGVHTTPLPNDPNKGMWQVGVRYDTIDLNDGKLLAPLVPAGAPRVDGVLGGKQNSWTVGVNWYWRSNFKFMLNYVMVDSSRYIGKTGATYSTNPANNNHTFNRVVNDSPNVLEARLQFYW